MRPTLLRPTCAKLAPPGSICTVPDCACTCGLATMGSALPYAIAAKFAFPYRLCVACTGDGAMQMNGNAERLTVAKYWKSWADPRIVFLALNNNDLDQVTWEQRIMGGYPKFTATQDLPPFDYARYAEQIGFLGITVSRPEKLAAAWDRALLHRRARLLSGHG